MTYNQFSDITLKMVLRKKSPRNFGGKCFGVCIWMIQQQQVLIRVRGQGNRH